MASKVASSERKGPPPEGAKFGPPPSLPRINLQDKLSWCKISPEEDVKEVLSHSERFQKLTDTKSANLQRLVGDEECFVLVKADFMVTEAYRYNSVGCLITFIHFAESAYVNGNMVGRYGTYAPAPLTSAFYVAHRYPVPDTLLNYDGENTIAFKIYCRGRSSFSGRMFISDMKDVVQTENWLNFWNSLSYIFVAGFMVSATLLFLIFFFVRRERKEYLSFALLNFFTAFSITYLFAGNIPVYAFLHISYDLFFKLFSCVNIFLIIYFYIRFLFDFVHIKESKISNSLRLFLLFARVLTVFLLPSYSMLMKAYSLLILTCVAEIMYGFLRIFLSLDSDERRYNMKLLLVGTIPIVFAWVFDYIFRFVFRMVGIPLMTMFGWVTEIFLFDIVLAVKFEKLNKANEYLNTKLQKEVELQTNNLKIANENLAKEIYHSNQDLQMASIIQKKYFSIDDLKVKDWDISIVYEALSNVSGDFFDYYTNLSGDELRGVSIFDVSGHGISASLVTMLAKNIVTQTFETGYRKKMSVSDILYSINSKITKDKGGIDNYLTGLLLQFSQVSQEGKADIFMANAGHPYPFLYSKKTDSVSLLKHGENQLQYGAIGITGIDVSFPTIEFSMEEGDVLILYTDGLVESENENKEQFGRERIREILQENAEKNSEEIVHALKDKFNAFIHHVPRNDDITVIVLKRAKVNASQESEIIPFIDNGELEEL